METYDQQNGIKPMQFEPLTEREKEVVNLVKKSGGNKKILSGTLGISPRTFDSHMKNVHLKTHTHDYAQVVIFAYEHPDLIQ